MEVIEKAKPFWWSANKSSVGDFIKLMDEHTLDPMALNYGRFAGVTPVDHYHPDHTPPEPVPYIRSMFYDLSWHYDGVPTKEEVLRVKKVVRDKMKSKEFHDAVLTRFNCVSIELTYFHTAETMKKPEFRGQFVDWYGTIKSEMIFPISSWWCQEFKDEWKRMNEKGKSLKKIASYYLKVQFYEKHYTNTEREELLNLSFLERRGNKYTVIGQAYRTIFDAKRLKHCKEYKFKCSGRRILYDEDSNYSLAYQEIDPFITKPTKL